jgi:hypothetical protein
MTLIVKGVSEKKTRTLAEMANPFNWGIPLTGEFL